MSKSRVVHLRGEFFPAVVKEISAGGGWLTTPARFDPDRVQVVRGLDGTTITHEAAVLKVTQVDPETGSVSIYTYPWWRVLSVMEFEV